ncbi:T9SS type A sorting domain-containing protein [Hymenobacter negativus]|uniref:T9SS type A sorting domain-containing protein n=1 Tax=Hymenobacter negativus TaxID=2795026 RepID=A0ABS0Q5E1_9BACT|nr:T9SS type A sorting domain-containing protein [Hymenobacter negativus]MBH8557792.1 T9SS type A sorting domain-containing protein [Hymenobacter negativus]
MKNDLLHSLLTLLLVLGLVGPARAATPPPPAGRPLAEALNPDGTLKAGANGSFDAHQFRMRTAPDGRPVFSAAGVAGVGDERWQGGFESTVGGVGGVVRTVVRSGTDVYIGGDFTTVGNLVANHVAKWNGTAWSSLGTGVANGVDRSVYALALAGNGDVYVGGMFTQAGGAAANRVARWSGTGWSALGTGVSNGSVSGPWDSYVYALAVASNGTVYAGGIFSEAGGGTANCVAKWDGTAWNPLGTGSANGVSGGNAVGINGALYTSVNVLAVAGNGNVYVGGVFNRAGNVVANRVARWDGTAWNPLGTGVSNGSGSNLIVYAMALASNGDVYVGGTFTQAGGAAANQVARWDGTAWSSLGTGAANGTDGSTGSVYSLVVANNGDVYVGGDFTKAGGVTANQVAKWNGTAWSGFGPDAGNGYVGALALAANSDVYVGGGFTRFGGVAAGSMARWNGTAWSPLGTSSVAGYVNTVAVAGNGDVYVGGQFNEAGGVIANKVAMWNGTAWSSLGTGAANGLDGDVSALAVAPNGDVYVGGFFSHAGGVAASHIAKWDGTAWNSLGTGAANGVGNGIAGRIVLALAVASNGDLFVGGEFTSAGGRAANCVAKWNGTTWSVLGTGITNGLNYQNVAALAVASNGDVYAGGTFTQAGGVTANCVAKWNGTAWSSLGTGVANGIVANIGSYTVCTLAIAGNGDVYVGGQFSVAGGTAANNLAKWNGTAWSSLVMGGANGVNSGSGINTLVVASNGDVYAGGYFTQASGGVANNVARWDGTAWSSLGTGLNGSVNKLAFGSAGKLYVGGTFSTTGDGSKFLRSFAIYDPNAPLATTPTDARVAATLYPNPAHGTATLRLPAGAPRQPLTLTDALGRPVRRYPAPTSAEAELDLRGLPAGTYVVRCGQLSQRLVVE